MSDARLQSPEVPTPELQRTVVYYSHMERGLPSWWLEEHTLLGGAEHTTKRKLTRLQTNALTGRGEEQHIGQGKVLGTSDREPGKRRRLFRRVVWKGPVVTPSNCMQHHPVPARLGR